MTYQEGRKKVVETIQVVLKNGQIFAFEKYIGIVDAKLFKDLTEQQEIGVYRDFLNTGLRDRRKRSELKPVNNNKKEGRKKCI